MGLVSSVGWLSFRHVNGTVLNGINCLLVKLVWLDRVSIAWLKAKLMAAEFFQFSYGAPMPPDFDDHPPSLPLSPVPSRVLPSAVDASSSSFPLSVAEHLAHPDVPFQRASYLHSKLLSRCGTPFDIAVPDTFPYILLGRPNGGIFVVGSAQSAESRSSTRRGMEGSSA